MAEIVTEIAEWSAALLEVLGVGLIGLLAVAAVVRGLVDGYSGNESTEVFRHTRLRLIRGILVGLEFLVAADIIHTVAIELTFESVGVLAAIVLIRTFLSFTLELEMTGKWPWQRDPQKLS